MVGPYQLVKRSLKRSEIVKPRSRSPIFFQMTIGIAIAIFEEDRDRDRDLNFGDRANALRNIDSENNSIEIFQGCIFLDSFAGNKTKIVWSKHKSSKNSN